MSQLTRILLGAIVTTVVVTSAMAIAPSGAWALSESPEETLTRVANNPNYNKALTDWVNGKPTPCCSQAYAYRKLIERSETRALAGKGPGAAGALLQEMDLLRNKGGLYKMGYIFKHVSSAATAFTIGYTIGSGIHKRWFLAKAVAPAATASAHPGEFTTQTAIGGSGELQAIRGGITLLTAEGNRWDHLTSIDMGTCSFTGFQSTVGNRSLTLSYPNQVEISRSLTTVYPPGTCSSPADAPYTKFSMVRVNHLAPLYTHGESGTGELPASDSGLVPGTYQAGSGELGESSIDAFTPTTTKDLLENEETAIEAPLFTEIIVGTEAPVESELPGTVTTPPLPPVAGGTAPDENGCSKWLTPSINMVPLNVGTGRVFPFAIPFVLGDILSSASVEPVSEWETELLGHEFVIDLDRFATIAAVCRGMFALMFFITCLYLFMNFASGRGKSE